MMKTLLLLMLLLSGQLFAQVPTVSILQLIATPEKYDGQVVRFEGVTHVEFEGNAIYVSKEHWKAQVSSFAIWMDLKEELAKSRQWLNGKYCIVEGTFHAKDRGHMGLFMGALSDVTMFDVREAVSPDEAKELQERAKTLQEQAEKEAAVLAGGNEGVCKVVGETYFSNYEPTVPKSLDDIPAPVREKVVAHLKKRLGEAFYASLRFAGGQVVDLAEFRRQEPNWRDFKWEVFAYRLNFQFQLPEKGIEVYQASIRLREDGSVIEEIDLPDMGKHPERAEFVALSEAVKLAVAEGFDVAKCDREMEYREKEDRCVYLFRQLDRKDGPALFFKCMDIDAHSGKTLRVFEQEGIE